MFLNIIEALITSVGDCEDTDSTSSDKDYKSAAYMSCQGRGNWYSLKGLLLNLYKNVKGGDQKSIEYG